MARIRLYVRQSKRTTAETVFDGRGASIILPFLRVFALIRVGLTSRKLTDCILDTGAPLSVFPRQSWKRFEHDIEWLSLPSSRAEGSWVTNLRGRTGGKSKCRIGRVFVELFDLEGPRQSLLGAPTIAQFEEDDSINDRIILGLHGGVLEHRRLILEPDLLQAWIEER